LSKLGNRRYGVKSGSVLGRRGTSKALGAENLRSVAIRDVQRSVIHDGTRYKARREKTKTQQVPGLDGGEGFRLMMHSTQQYWESFMGEIRSGSWIDWIHVKCAGGEPRQWAVEARTWDAGRYAAGRT